MIICYRKKDLQLVGTVLPNLKPSEEILLNVIPNFGGTIEDYDWIETDEQYFHLELLEGLVSVVKDDAPTVEIQPSEFEQLANHALEVDFRVVLLEMGLK